VLQQRLDRPSSRSRLCCLFASATSDRPMASCGRKLIAAALPVGWISHCQAMSRAGRQPLSTESVFCCCWSWLVVLGLLEQLDVWPRRTTLQSVCHKNDQHMTMFVKLMGCMPSCLLLGLWTMAAPQRMHRRFSTAEALMGQ
jgi:hypothetical protein